MRDLSLHILDLLENSLRASVSVISLTLATSSEKDLVTIKVEDDGPGFSVSPEVALDPFYTTKGGKKVGLGLSLFRSTAERAGGGVTIGRSPLGGASVEASMRWAHVDRAPLGDLAATCSAVVCTNPQMDLVVYLSADGRALRLSSLEVARDLPGGAGEAAKLARKFDQSIRAGMAYVWPEPVWDMTPVSVHLRKE